MRLWSIMTDLEQIVEKYINKPWNWNDVYQISLFTNPGMEWFVY